MSKQKGTLCYAPLVQKIQEMDTAIKDLKLRIEKLKTVFSDGESEMEDCPDEIESELAMMEIMKDIYMEAIIADEDPENEA